jgi:hypothetical protein
MSHETSAFSVSLSIKLLKQLEGEDAVLYPARAVSHASLCLQYRLQDDATFICFIISLFPTLTTMAASHLKILLLSLFAIAGNTVSALEVGDIVCVQGYVMDYYCIDNGDMIDNGKLTLEEPFDHTVHCLGKAF